MMLPVEIIMIIMDYISDQKIVKSLLVTNKAFNRFFKYNLCNNVRFNIRKLPIVKYPYIVWVELRYYNFDLGLFPNLKKILLWYESSVNKFPEKLKYLCLYNHKGSISLKGLKFIETLKILGCPNIHDKLFKNIEEIGTLDLNMNKKNHNLSGKLFEYVKIKKKLDINGCHSLKARHFKHLNGIECIHMRYVYNNASNILQYIKKIKELDVSSCYIRDKDFKNLIVQDVLYVECLHDGITDMAFQYFGNLRELYISNNQKIIGQGFMYLKNIVKMGIALCHNVCDISLSYLSKIRYLKLFNCKNISDKGLVYLQNIEKLKINHLPLVQGITLFELKKLNYIKVYYCHSIDINKVKKLGIKNEIFGIRPKGITT